MHNIRRNLQVEYELSSFRTDSIIICRYWELAAKITDCIFIKENCQFKNDGTTPFFIGQIPDAFTQNGIDHRPYLILSTPYGIEISHVNVSNELKYGESR